jgi:hypothetical protein
MHGYMQKILWKEMGTETKHGDTLYVTAVRPIITFAATI